MVIRRPPSRCLCYGTCAAEKRGYVHDLDHNVIGLKRSLVGKGSSVREMKTTLSVPFSDPRFHVPVLAFRFNPRLYVQSLLLLPVLTFISTSSTLHGRLPSSTACGTNPRQSFTNHMGSSSRNTLMHTLGSSPLQLEE